MSLVIFCLSPEKKAQGQKLLPKFSCIWIKVVLFPYFSLTTPYCRFPAFSYGILASIQNDRGQQGAIMRKASVVILNEREGSITVRRKAVKCHQCNRFFALCHIADSRFSHKTFLPKL